MQATQIIQILQDQQEYLKSRYLLKGMSLYGSYAKGNQHKESDIDLLYSTPLEAPMTLARLHSLENYLGDLLKIKKIELVNERSLNPIVASNIQDDVITIF